MAGLIKSRLDNQKDKLNICSIISVMVRTTSKGRITNNKKRLITVITALVLIAALGFPLLSPTVALADIGDMPGGPVIDTLEFETEKCEERDIIHVSDDVYAIFYKESGHVTTVEITTTLARVVGGEVYPANKLAILAPWIGLAVALALAGVFITRFARRKVRS